MNTFTQANLQTLNNWIAENSADSTKADVTQDLLNRDSVKELMDNFDTVKKEVEDCLSHIDPIKGSPYFIEDFVDDKWYKYFIQWHGPISDLSYKLFPKTLQIYNKHDELTSMLVSILKPGSIIGLHSGPWKGHLRGLLGIDTPNNSDCFIEIDFNKHIFEDRKLIGFDDTYMHTASNNTEKDRTVLFFNVERKMNTPENQIILNKWNNLGKQNGLS